jgi:hypothetical protein
MKPENPLSCCVQVLCVDVDDDDDDDSSSLAFDTVEVEYGRAGYRSLCLMHAEHALYHLSYIPSLSCKQFTDIFIQ